MGWYGNNCGCSEHQSVRSWGPPPGGTGTDGVHHYQGDIQATIDFGFDGIKLDGCGEFKYGLHHASSTPPPHAPIRRPFLLSP